MNTGRRPANGASAANSAIALPLSLYGRTPLDLVAREGSPGQAGLRVAQVDPRLADLVVQQEIKVSVAVGIDQVSRVVCLGAVPLRRLLSIAETDGRGVDRRTVEQARMEDGDGDRSRRLRKIDPPPNRDRDAAKDRKSVV